MKGSKMQRILGAPRRVRVAVGGLFVLSAVLVSTGLASVAGVATSTPTQQQAGHINLVGEECNNDGNNTDGPPYPTPSCTSKSASPSKSESMSPSPTPSESKSMSPSPSKSESVSPTPSATVSPTEIATTTAAPVLPVTGGSSVPLALVSGGLLLSGLTLLGFRLFMARRT
jgi:hypothetical protein